MGDTDQHLSDMATRWTLIRQGQVKRDLPESRIAQWQLLERYGGAIHRYLLGAVREPDLAGDLSQEFAVRFLQGDLKGADPGKGRFRDFVKGVLRNLVASHFRRERRRPMELSPDHPEPGVDDPPSAEDEQAFVACWREEFLARGWKALQRFEAETGQPYHTVLRYRADHPDEASEDMARALGERLGRAITSAGMRKALQRAREKFADLMLEDLAASLSNPTQEAIERELIDLELYEYCRPALDRNKR
jgi:DNA-directed RNA polymerase specialized sigma24 family protein